MSSLTENLKQWRKSRNIKYPDTKVYIANVIEELLEIYFKNKTVIKILQSIIMVIFSIKKPISELNTIDAIQDIQVFSINETELMGYDNYFCNWEVFQEIDSRQQDPLQKLQWEEVGAFGKWQKDKNQDKSTLYTANYSKCRLAE